jgi:hypothetical protein
MHHICYACQYLVSIDDSIDDQTLAAMIAMNCLDDDDWPGEDALAVGNVRIKMAVCSECDNDENHLVCIIGVDETAGTVSVQCLECGHQIAIPVGRSDSGGAEQMSKRDNDGGRYSDDNDGADQINSSAPTENYSKHKRQTVHVYIRKEKLWRWRNPFQTRLSSRGHCCCRQKTDLDAGTQGAKSGTLDPGSAQHLRGPTKN